MYFQSDDQRFQVLAKLSLIALYILLAYDLIIIALGYFLSLSNNLNGSGDPLILDIVFLIAVADLIGTYIIKKYMLNRAHLAREGNSDEIKAYRMLLNITLVIVLMCSAISTYGLILVILGEKFEMLVLFVAISLIGYQFFRLRPRDFDDEFEKRDRSS